MYKIVLLNHGECEWESGNLFVGWTDSGLMEKGIQAAQKAGDILAKYIMISNMRFYHF